jgi:hypothetical protein
MLKVDAPKQWSVKLPPHSLRSLRISRQSLYLETAKTKVHCSLSSWIGIAFDRKHGIPVIFECESNFRAIQYRMYATTSHGKMTGRTLQQNYIKGWISRSQVLLFRAGECVTSVATWRRTRDLCTRKQGVLSWASAVWAPISPGGTERQSPIQAFSIRMNDVSSERGLIYGSILEILCQEPLHLQSAEWLCGHRRARCPLWRGTEWQDCWQKSRRNVCELDWQTAERSLLS